MFPRLDFDVKSVPSMEEKLKIVQATAGKIGHDRVHFFDDSLPLATSMGTPFNRTKMEMDKAVLMKKHDDATERWDELSLQQYKEMKERWMRVVEGSSTFKRSPRKEK